MAGWLEKPTAARAAVSEQHAWWWKYARASAMAFRAGQAPPEVEVFGPVLDDGESVYFSGSAQYARMYGGDGSYSTTGFIALGSPAVLAGSVAATTYINRRRKVAAAREAVVQWRSHQQVAIIGTSHRLLVHVADKGWLSFYYSAVSEYYPDPQTWSLTLGFGEQCSPLRLVGLPVPAACVLVCVALDPQRWWRDPRLASLLTAAQE